MTKIEPLLGTLTDGLAYAMAIVSHRHVDHLGGMEDILEAFPVERFVRQPRGLPKPYLRRQTA